LPQAPAPPDTLDGFLHSEWQHFIDSLEYATPARWVNLPSAEHRARRKAYQLSVARQVGLRTPATLLTNDPAAVHAFLENNEAVIYKHIGEGRHRAAIARRLTTSDLDRLAVLPSCPAIFQEHIPARLDLRITVLGTEMHAVEIDSQAGDGALDWRLDHSVEFKSHVLESKTAQQLHSLMTTLGLLYGAIDMRLTPAGEYVFLEINPGGQFLFLDLLAGTSLAERMAAFLTDK
jgi:glutathione synthase/RimK-type ligase-like ATP-grasp enzyme